MTRKNKSSKVQLCILIIAIVLIFFEMTGLNSKFDKLVDKIEDFDIASGLFENTKEIGAEVTEAFDDITTSVEDTMNGLNTTDDFDSNNQPNSTFEDILDANLSVHFIDVDQGDSTLISYNDYNMLIDTGEYTEADKLITYLESVGVNEIDTFVGTHPHSDHIGAVTEVFDAFDIKEVIIPNATHTTKTFEKMITAIENENTEVIEAKAGYTFSIDDLSYEILSPLRDEYSDLNDYSVVILMKYKDMDFIFSGDATKLVEKDILETGKNIEVDILKLGHHGSRTSSSDEYIEATNADVAIISVGAENDYGHPHSEVVETLDKYNIETLRTDLNGNIVLYTDGYKYNIQNN